MFRKNKLNRATKISVGHLTKPNASLGNLKDQNIGKHGYIGNWILRKYRKYRKISVDILTKISVMEKLTKIL